MTKARDLLTTAADLVAGDRDRTHGDKVANFQAIASIWNGYILARTVTGRGYMLCAEDVANMMELLKVARRLSGDFNIDDFVDAAGYAACGGEIASRSQPRAA